MKYKVVKEYCDAPKHPIKIEKGEILQFIEESNPDGDWANWVYCRGVDKEGWVPKQILSIEGSKVLSLKDYIAKEHNLIVNEILIADHDLNGWIWATKENLKDVSAWAPLNCLEII
jgi:hypothetical protein